MLFEVFLHWISRKTLVATVLTKTPKSFTSCTTPFWIFSRILLCISTSTDASIFWAWRMGWRCLWWRRWSAVRSCSFWWRFWVWLSARTRRWTLNKNICYTISILTSTTFMFHVTDTLHWMFLLNYAMSLLFNKRLLIKLLLLLLCFQFIKKRFTMHSKEFLKVSREVGLRSK